MSSITDFLFEGKPPKSVSTYGQTIESIPKWMSDYTQGLIARANSAAAEPYIPYGGPRIAPFSGEEEEAFNLVGENVGSTSGMRGEAAGAVRGGLDAFSERADPYGAGAPYAAKAGEAFPDAVGRYMDPYVQNVLNRQESLATRTLNENFLPSLQRSFMGAGQMGSRGGFGSMEDIGVRGIRGISENLEEQRLATLSGAYGQAGELFGADATRNAQLAQTMGGLEEAGGRLDIQRGMAGFEGARTLSDVADSTSRQGYTDAAALESVGRSRRDMGQRSLDTAYGDFREQRDLPFERIDFMSDTIRGLPSGRTTQRNDFGPADIYQPSGLAQIAGAYGTYKGLTGNAEGGYIDHNTGRYMEGGLAFMGKT